MSRPRVSVLLPNLNNRPFLDERLDTILKQTFTDWELIVWDSCSDDGAWEFFVDAAKRDPRIKAIQAPRQGLYPDWNNCLSKASGDLVYFATSDDTMTPNCLEELVAALDHHPECNIAQCCLHAIDEKSRVIEGWWQLVAASQYLGPIYLQPHLRMSPVDGILHCGVGTIYHSITQLLIRRCVFHEQAPFTAEFGHGGDFLWGLEAGLRHNVVHVPKFLATWRIHASQASAGNGDTIADKLGKLAMIDRALERFERPSRFPSRYELRFPYTFHRWRLEWARPGFKSKLSALFRCLFTEPRAFAHFLYMRSVTGLQAFDQNAYILNLIKRYGLESGIVIDPLAAPRLQP